MEILRSIVGRLCGLDKDDSLLVRGGKLILSYAGVAPSALEVSGGVLYVNGVAVGSSGGGTSTDITLSASQQDLSVSSDVARVCMTPAGGGSTLGGITAPVNDDTVKCLTNESASDSITITHQDAGSSALNRFTLPNGASVILLPSAITYIRYVKTGWRVI